MTINLFENRTSWHSEFGIQMLGFWSSTVQSAEYRTSKIQITPKSKFYLKLICRQEGFNVVVPAEVRSILPSHVDAVVEVATPEDVVVRKQVTTLDTKK